MAVALKKHAGAPASRPSVTLPLVSLAGNSSQASATMSSPARELQDRLRDRIENQQKPRFEIVSGIVAGAVGASCFTGLLALAIV